MASAVCHILDEVSGLQGTMSKACILTRPMLHMDMCKTLSFNPRVTSE